MAFPLSKAAPLDQEQVYDAIPIRRKYITPEVRTALNHDLFVILILGFKNTFFDETTNEDFTQYEGSSNRGAFLEWSARMGRDAFQFQLSWHADSDNISKLNFILDVTWDSSSSAPEEGVTPLSLETSLGVLRALSYGARSLNEDLADSSIRSDFEALAASFSAALDYHGSIPKEVLILHSVRIPPVLVNSMEVKYVTEMAARLRRGVSLSHADYSRGKRGTLAEIFRRGKTSLTEFAYAAVIHTYQSVLVSQNYGQKPYQSVDSKVSAMQGLLNEAYRGSASDCAIYIIESFCINEKIKVLSPDNDNEYLYLVPKDNKSSADPSADFNAPESDAPATADHVSAPYGYKDDGTPKIKPGKQATGKAKRRVAVFLDAATAARMDADIEAGVADSPSEWINREIKGCDIKGCPKASR